jgi:hypothetical protein
MRCGPAIRIILTPVEHFRRQRVALLVECDNEMRILRVGRYIDRLTIPGCFMKYNTLLL